VSTKRGFWDHSGKWGVVSGQKAGRGVVAAVGGCAWGDGRDQVFGQLRDTGFEVTVRKVGIAQVRRAWGVGEVG
jgi:hypothetical protein